MTLKPTATEKLRLRMADDALIVMPSCFDALSAKLIAQAGFEVTFMSGFAVSAARIGAPDLGLMSYGEVLDQTADLKPRYNRYGVIGLFQAILQGNA